jgi:hypothetical protein
MTRIIIVNTIKPPSRIVGAERAKIKKNKTEDNMATEKSNVLEVTVNLWEETIGITEQVLKISSDSRNVINASRMAMEGFDKLLANRRKLNA